MNRTQRPNSYSRRIQGIQAVFFAAALLCEGSTARADLVINAVFDSTITSDPNAATIESTINAAIQVYEARFADSVTVTINFAKMSSGLGQSSTFFSTISYSQYITALQADATTNNDTVALSHLPTGTINPVDGSTNIDVTTANLRAIGINVNPPPGSPDSFIGLNTSLMNLDRTSINPAKYDLMAVASHEIDEALGMGSGLNGGNSRPQDLFRYSGNGVRSYTTSTSATSYFSIDGGATNLVNFNQSGGGADYGDWKSSSTHRVQDAFGTPGATPNLGVELTNLDVIGYDLKAVPEPASLVLMGVGALAISGLGWMRRKR